MRHPWGRGCGWCSVFGQISRAVNCNVTGSDLLCFNDETWEAGPDEISQTNHYGPYDSMTLWVAGFYDPVALAAFMVAFLARIASCSAVGKD